MGKSIILVLSLAFILSSCNTGQNKSGDVSSLFDQTKEKYREELKKVQKGNEDFLAVKSNVPELFRILFTSDDYIVVQTRAQTIIKRVKDNGGDRYMMEELKKYDIMNEARESIVEIKLYPDTGRVMQIRPYKATYLKEIDKLLLEDIQRWNFEFPKKYVSPLKFTVRYRVALRKKQSDEEIMKERRQKMLEEQ
jgi:predicted small secreted protein